MTGLTLVWLRRDLRLLDNPALAAAADRGRVIPVFIWAPEEDGDWAPGAAGQVWLHDSLANLDTALRDAGSRLIIRRGRTMDVLTGLSRELKADAVYWNRLYDPDTVPRDARIKSVLRERGVDARSFNGALFNEPPAITNKQGKPFRVFTPFYKHCKSLGTPRQLHAIPKPMRGPRKWPRSEPLESLSLRPPVAWDTGIRDAWMPGERGAHRELDSFADAAVEHYDSERDHPGVDGVSRLSPHLHFGEISPQQVWHGIESRWPGPRDNTLNVTVEPFIRQLYWREFAHHLLFHFPHTTHTPMHEKFSAFPWRHGGEALCAWQQGRTGYPLVDAGMRELWTTGWMHNRVRMNVASFLVKHLLIHWRDGANWFWDTLVDADLASNSMGWQWAAGCGADAAPYFRIFNPVLQGQRFDSKGRYVRRWIPELKDVPDKYIHTPWLAPDAGIQLGKDYPFPIVDHSQARQNALDALAKV